MSENRHRIVPLEYAALGAGRPVAGLLDHQVAQMICAIPLVFVVLPCIAGMATVLALIVRG